MVYLMTVIYEWLLNAQGMRYSTAMVWNSVRRFLLKMAKRSKCSICHNMSVSRAQRCKRSYNIYVYIYICTYIHTFIHISFSYRIYIIYIHAYIFILFYIYISVITYTFKHVRFSCQVFRAFSCASFEMFSVPCIQL